MVEAVELTFGALVDGRGRLGVRIFGLPRDQAIMVSVAVAMFVLPVTAFVATLPFWDRVGDWLKPITAYVAPAVDSFSSQVQSGQIPPKRFLTAALCIVLLIVLSNFVSLLSRGVRKRALLVWICYDRTRIFRYFVISSLVFGAFWWLLFVDWRGIDYLMSGRRGGAVVIGVMLGIPFAAFVFGRLTSIVALGALRAISRKVGRPWRSSA